MAYRSWLKDVKSIHDLGEHCHSLNFRKPEDEARGDKYDQKWLQRLRADIPVKPEDKFAFGTRMHDSWVEWAKRDQNQLKIRVNNDFAQHFVQQICQMLGIHVSTFLNTKYRQDIDLAQQGPDLVTPVDLVFEDVCYVNSVRYGPGGTLRWAEWRNLGRRERTYEADAFLYDWFFQQGGRIQWICEIWNPTSSNALSSSQFLLVDCSLARAEDGRSKAIGDVFPQAVTDIWNDLLSGEDLDPNRDPWNQVRECIQKSMERRSLKLNDLMPEIERSPLAIIQRTSPSREG